MSTSEGMGVSQDQSRAKTDRVCGSCCCTHPEACIVTYEVTSSRDQNATASVTIYSHYGTTICSSHIWSLNTVRPFVKVLIATVS